MTEHEFFLSVGGKAIIKGNGETEWNFGWISTDDLAPGLWEIRQQTIRDMPHFHIDGQWFQSERRYKLWEAGKILMGGHFLPYANQTTGSCVGAGGYNMLITLLAVEIVLGKEAEKWMQLWWPYTYGRSRLASGMRGRGEGSTGAGWTKAITQDGSFEWQEGLPKYQDVKGWLKLPSGDELNWSAGEAIDAKWIEQGRKHLVKTVSPLKNSNEALAALANGYPITQASMFGFSPMVPSPTGTPPVRLVSWNGSWSHQTYIDEAWDHPTHGLIFRWGNNWGADAHGPALDDEPPSSVYIKAATLDRICSSGEVYAFSAYDGFPARKLDWYI